MAVVNKDGRAYDVWLAFSTTTPLANGETYDSGYISLVGQTQVQTSVLSDVDGTITINFCNDTGAPAGSPEGEHFGVDITRTLTIPYVGGSGFQMFAAPAFTPFVRYRFTADAAGQTDFLFDTKITRHAIQPQLLGVEAFISPAMSSELVRSVLVGKTGAGNYSNVSVVETTNDTGTFNALNVVAGARPSQLTGRTPVSIMLDRTASGLDYTVTSGKTLYITDVYLSVQNSATNSEGRVNLRDGTTVAGNIIHPLLIEESGTSVTAVTTVCCSLLEPMEFSTGVYTEEAAGTLLITGMLKGYEE